jgi:hypothetical protein
MGKDSRKQERKESAKKGKRERKRGGKRRQKKTEREIRGDEIIEPKNLDYYEPNS